MTATSIVMSSRKRLLGTRQYSPAEQKEFASLSGDFNPLHVDPIAARRAMFGEPVVHGMHLVAWALEAYLTAVRRRGVNAFSIRMLSAVFSKPVLLREKVSAFLTAETASAANIQVIGGDVLFADIDIRSGTVAGPTAYPEPSRDHYPTTPKAYSIRDLPGLSGTTAISTDPLVADYFPTSCALLGAGVIARLLALSRLVGMECPGLNSLLSSFEVQFVPDEGNVLSFAIEQLDPRISLVHIRVGGAGVSGTIKVFLRPAPTEQPRMEALAATVAPGEFAPQCALIIGGSRGLGEVTAKIIASGGGRPIITYCHGEDDARAVVEQIRRCGAMCEMLRLDVARPRKSLVDLVERGWSPTHLYYFATPRIFVRKSALFDHRLFRRFQAVYVNGFFRTYIALRRVRSDLLRVFYPSSVALEDHLKELTEYAAAKAAGEMLCRHIERFDAAVRILVERLPRIRTDQTATILPVPAADAARIMYRIAHKLTAL